MAGKGEYVDVTKSPPVYEEQNASNPDNRASIKALKADAKAKKDAQSPKDLSKGAFSKARVSIAEKVAMDIRSLDVGDPNESISVPMILSTEKRSIKDFIKGRSGDISQQVIVRKMTRDHYKKYYAKDKDGNYVGNEKAAPDAGLVFVPSKSTPEDILEQVRKVAFGKQHHVDDFGGNGAYGGMGGVQ